MTDAILVATMILFFVAAALLVRLLARVVADPAGDAAPDEDPDSAELEPGRTA